MPGESAVPGRSDELDRRGFLHRSAVAASGALLAAAAPAGAVKSRPVDRETNRLLGMHQDLSETTVADLQAAMERGALTAKELVRRYTERIEASNEKGPELRALIERNPDAERIAAELDAERKQKGPRGPLHGIPVLLKDNIDTADRMLTTAGSLALVGSKPAQDAFVAGKLREAGAVILGKTNLSEWANIRSSRSISGWSGRGGQCRNPYVVTHNPCGSSSGSAVAVSSNLCVAALATETDGSIVCPAHINGVVGIKPTLGLTSRAGVVPISHSQDTIGSHARTVRDAALVLGVITGADPRDPATAGSDGKLTGDYSQFLDPNGLHGARIGVARKSFFGYSPKADQVIEHAIETMRKLGAEIVDPADVPTIDKMNTSPGEITVLLYDLKADMSAYLAARVPGSGGGDPIPRTLEDLIRFNQEHAAEEMPYFGQELFEQALAKGPLTDKEYLDALETNHRLSRAEGIDAVMDQHRLDALVAPTGNPAWPIDFINGDHFLGGSSSPAAMAGYPLVTVPAGFVMGLPVGLTFMGRAYSEPVLIRLAYAFEQATKVRRAPSFLAELETT